MPRRPTLTSLPAALAVVLGVLTIATPSAAQREQVLYNFDASYLPDSNLVFDQSGNLYGTGSGALCSTGSVFELMPGQENKWTEQDLYDFCSQNNCQDGAWPQGGVIIDTAGNLYGTTVCGGSQNGGVVFELTRGKEGWTEIVLHNFGGGTDGADPYAGVIFDAAGNLYGTTSSGGAYKGGTVFKLSPGPNGTWTEKVLHSFEPGHTGYVSGPIGGVVFDTVGNLYGTTYGGGLASDNCDPTEASCGRVFELSPGANGKWAEKTLHRFRGLPDGANPWAGVTLDKAGNVYGTTYYGGTGQCYSGYGKVIGCGVVFRLSLSQNGKWSETVLHSFVVNGFDGSNPFAKLTSGSSGNLYGTTSGGGTRAGGTIFKMTQHPDGEWTESVIYNFGRYGDGADPEAGLIFGATGKLYGTTGYGGEYGDGTVFEVAP
jgi:uncharacterized repeat protein (TIGR03803 family)